jgi:hypothetical protein
MVQQEENVVAIMLAVDPAQDSCLDAPKMPIQHAVQHSGFGVYI